jgi:hypothetical protein
MSFEKHIEDFGLTQETNITTPAVDFSKFKCTLSKGVVYINKAITDTMKLDDSSFLEVHTGIQSGALVIGMKSVGDASQHTLKPKLLKTKPSKLAIAPLLLKHSLSSSRDYTIDLVDVEEGYIVFAIIAPVAVGAGDTGAGKGAPMGGGGVEETVPDWSDF